MNRLAFYAVLIPVLALALCAPPKASESAYALSRDEARAVICFEGSAWDCDHMLAISWRESRWQPAAQNINCYPKYPYMYVCWGLLQHLLPVGVDGTWLLDPWANAQLAHDKYLDGGTAVHWRATQ